MDKLKRLVKTSLDNDKAQEIVAIPLTGKSSLADFMVIASGTSQRHLNTLADHLEMKLKALGLPHVYVEGRSSEGWVVVDAGDVIIHLFKPDIRTRYNLEKMWGLDLPKAPRREAEMAP